MALQKSPSRILHLPRRFVAEEWGGTETVILEISRQQKRMGYSPEIYTSMACATLRWEEIGGIPVRRFRYCYPYWGLSVQEKAVMDKKGGNLISPSLFAALLRAPDVRMFHAHAVNRMGGHVRSAARLRRKPYVVSLHGGYFDIPEKELAGLTRASQGKWEWGKAIGALIGSRKVLEDADYVLCVGHNEYEKAKENLGHSRVDYLPNGVDPAKFAEGRGEDFRAQYGIPGDAYLILNVSRIDRQKNQRLLLEAFRNLLKRNPKTHLVFIGPVTQSDYAEELQQLIAQWNLDGKVHLLPGMGHDDSSLIDAYHACDVFVLPSVHEPFGIVVLEAWSCRKPVVASNVGGLKRLVTPEQNGLVIDVDQPAGPEELARLLTELHANPQFSHELGEAGYREVMAHYTWDSVAKRLEAVYRLAEEHAARRSKAR